MSFLEEDPDTGHHQDDCTDGSDDDVGGHTSLRTAESLDTFDLTELLALSRDLPTGAADPDGFAQPVPGQSSIFFQEILIFPH